MTETTPILVLVFGTVLFTLFAVFTVLFIALQKKKQYYHHLEKQKLEHRYKTELMQSRLEVQEQTLKNLSLEVHDGIGTKLSMTRMQVFELAKHVHDDYKDNARDALESMGEIVKRIRNISHVMNGSYMLKSGLADGIKEDLAVIQSATSIKCDLSITGTPFSLDKDRELIVFRMIQESIANAVKHAQPCLITVILDYSGAYLKAVISDDGVGFDTTNKGKTTGMGQYNITERTRLLNGTAVIRSQPGNGTIIEIQIPI